MDPEIFRILEAKRDGRELSRGDVRAAVAGAASGAWGDAEVGAFLMAVAIRGLGAEETRELTLAMLESGERWELGSEFSGLGDKHSTGGVGDKVSLVLAPLMAACGRPVVMLTGRGLGHTAGTADKLEAIPGVVMELDRGRCRRALAETALAIGMATSEIAPADRRLYALRDRTGTVASLPLMTGSILSKKLATGAAAIVFDVKTGNGAFLPEPERGEELARLMVETCESLGCRARALITDMSQPLGHWVGHAAEVREALDCLEGRGPADLMEVTYALCEELSELSGRRLTRAELERAIGSGEARERFARWAVIQGADPAWMKAPKLETAPHEAVIAAPRAGRLAAVDTRRLGELLAAAGGGRMNPHADIDFAVSLKAERKLGDEVAAGDALARLYLRREDAARVESFKGCFAVADEAEPAVLVRGRIVPEGS